MEKIVVFGAGNIGRSFIGPVFGDAGYEVVFADIDESILTALNDRNAYAVVEKADGQPDRVTRVSPVRGIHANDQVAVERELAEARIAATAVGDRAFDAVVRTIGSAVSTRHEPLDVILAENLHRASERARSVLSEEKNTWDAFGGSLGLVESSIGKMVPIVPADVRAHDPLICWAEPYNTLLVDAAGFLNTIPAVADLRPVAPFAPWVERKLYIHNLGHAATAYLGYRDHPDAVFLWEVLEDPALIDRVRSVMVRSAEALWIRHPESFSEDALIDHVEDLLRRFRNRTLGDTVYRVGRDLGRKLRRDDRIVGAIRSIMEADLDPGPLIEVFQAATGFTKRDPAGNRHPEDVQFLETFHDRGAAWLLRDVVGLTADDADLMRLLERAVG